MALRAGILYYRGYWKKCDPLRDSEPEFAQVIHFCLLGGVVCLGFIDVIKLTFSALLCGVFSLTLDKRGRKHLVHVEHGRERFLHRLLRRKYVCQFKHAILDFVFEL